MLDFTVEKYEDCISEVSAYYPSHYDELASNKEIPLDPSYDSYDVMAKAGLLHVVVARKDGVLVGYHISIVMRHLHYRKSLTAMTDIYYLRKDCRKGMNGVNLFKFMESSLKAIGVERIYMMTKTDFNKGAILERLGYVEKERIYTKMIGD